MKKFLFNNIKMYSLIGIMFINAGKKSEHKSIKNISAITPQQFEKSFNKKELYDYDSANLFLNKNHKNNILIKQKKEKHLQEHKKEVSKNFENNIGISLYSSVFNSSTIENILIRSKNPDIYNINISEISKSLVENKGFSSALKSVQRELISKINMENYKNIIINSTKNPNACEDTLDKKIKTLNDKMKNHIIENSEEGIELDEIISTVKYKDLVKWYAIHSDKNIKQYISWDINLMNNLDKNKKKHKNKNKYENESKCREIINFLSSGVSKVLSFGDKIARDDIFAFLKNLLIVAINIVLLLAQSCNLSFSIDENNSIMYSTNCVIKERNERLAVLLVNNVIQWALLFIWNKIFYNNASFILTEKKNKEKKCSIKNICSRRTIKYLSLMMIDSYFIATISYFLWAYNSTKCETQDLHVYKIQP